MALPLPSFRLKDYIPIFRKKKVTQYQGPVEYKYYMEAKANEAYFKKKQGLPTKIKKNSPYRFKWLLWKENLREIKREE